MRYHFSEREIEALSRLNIPFNFLGDLDDEQELALLDIVGDAMDYEGYGEDGGDQSTLGEMYGDILTHMAQQANLD